MGNTVIHIATVSKVYVDSDVYALNNLSLDIKQGEIFGLLGPNGAGKTTLISILSGLIKPSSGLVEIKGLRYKKDRKTMLQLIGIVPQEYALYPTLTAKENLIYFGAMYGVKQKELRVKVDFLLKELGLYAFKDKKIQSFSGGMKRRINLIAGTLHNPEILFLDEPTVGVDVQSRHVIIDYLKSLNKEGTTIIYTSHHMEEAQEFCSKIAIIDSGEILIKGSPIALIESIKNAQRLEDVYLHLTGEKLRDNV
ncbi:MAG: ABC transporter ATP-binding protein [Flavobacteriaceae bacterium]|nr:ABC transporter ATP-binding protein [Flavobacteriaceae bacterium]